jgi:hypothetical protein
MPVPSLTQGTGISINKKLYHFFRMKLESVNASCNIFIKEEGGITHLVLGNSAFVVGLGIE